MRATKCEVLTLYRIQYLFLAWRFVFTAIVSQKLAPHVGARLHTHGHAKQI